MMRKVMPPDPEQADADNTAAREAEALTFFAALFGEIESGNVVLSKVDENGDWADSVASADLSTENSLVELARTAIRMSETSDVYVATSVMNGTKRHGDAVLATPAVWTEFDFAASSEVKSYQPWRDQDEVMEFLNERIGLPPSITIASGNGLHCYWKFDEALTWWGGDKEAIGETVLSRWEQWLHAQADAAGHGLDTVVDLGRVLRVPGTFNRKAEPKPVTTIDMRPEIVYGSQDLDDHIPAAYVGRSLRTQARSTSGTVDTRFVTDEEVLAYIKSFGSETKLDDVVSDAEVELKNTLGGRHFGLLRGLGVLIQNQHRGNINMGAVLKDWSEKFDEIKPPNEQTRDEFDKAVRAVTRKRMAELDALYGGGDGIVDMIPFDETLGDVDDTAPARMIRGGHSDVRDPGFEAAEVDRLAGQYRINQKAREVAQHQLAEERFDREWEMPEFVGLQEFIMRQYEPVEYRVEGLWTTESKMLLSAEAKAGKTTLVLNLLDAMIDGGKFLGRFNTKKPDGRIVFVNFEVSERQMHEWLSRGRARDLDKAIIANDVGRAGMWDVRLKKNRDALAASFTQMGATVLIIDTLGMILDALGIEENSNSEVGEVLSGFDTLLAESDINELLIVHHFGHSGDRARGASKLLGWPDALWTYHIETDTFDTYDLDLPDTPRFLSVKGRDVTLPKSEVAFDALTNSVSMERDAGTPRRVIAERKSERDVAAVVSAVKNRIAAGAEYATRAEIEDDAGIAKGMVNEAIKVAKNRGELTEEPGKKNARWFRIGPGRRSIASYIRDEKSLETPLVPLVPPGPPGTTGDQGEDPLRAGPPSLRGEGGTTRGTHGDRVCSPLRDGGPEEEKSEATEAMSAALDKSSREALAEMPMGETFPDRPDSMSPPPSGPSDDAEIIELASVLAKQSKQSRKCPTCSKVRISVGGRLVCMNDGCAE